MKDCADCEKTAKEADEHSQHCLCFGLIAEMERVKDKAYLVAVDADTAQKAAFVMLSEIKPLVEKYRAALERISNEGGPDFDADDMADCATRALSI